MADSLSGFYVDVLRWRGSKSVQRMSFSERGVYFEMMCEQWEKRHLPDDPLGVAAILALTPAQAQEVLDAWPTVRAKFLKDEKREGRIYNARLEKTRRQQDKYRQKKRLAGQKGGKAKAAKHSFQSDLPSSSAIAVLAPALASPSVEKRREEKSREERKEELFAGASSVDADPDGNRVRLFVERYPRIYAECRAGASYRVREARDFPAFEELTDREPDDARLDALLKLFLSVKSKDFLNIPGTPRQFLHMLPECDRLLREHRQ